MLCIIQSFHKGMKAVIRVRDDVTNKFDVRNGLRQGCTMAPKQLLISKEKTISKT